MRQVRVLPHQAVIISGDDKSSRICRCCLRCSESVSTNCEAVLCNTIIMGRALMLGTFAIMVFCMAFYWEEVKYSFMLSLQWIDDLGPVYGALILCVMTITAAVLFLPCLPFTLGAGKNKLGRFIETMLRTHHTHLVNC
jgi:hypothetical protein